MNSYDERNDNGKFYNYFFKRKMLQIVNGIIITQEMSKNKVELQKKIMDNY